jgi:nucleotide-binding universal stress UspA family protein
MYQADVVFPNLRVADMAVALDKAQKMLIAIGDPNVVIDMRMIFRPQAEGAVSVPPQVPASDQMKQTMVIDQEAVAAKLAADLKARAKKEKVKPEPEVMEAPPEAKPEPEVVEAKPEAEAEAVSDADLTVLLNRVASKHPERAAGGRAFIAKYTTDGSTKLAAVQADGRELLAADLRKYLGE